MKIKKFTKTKNGIYVLLLDNDDKIKVHEDLILKYNLLLTKEVSSEVLEDIQSENRVYESYDVALKYINIKLRSKKELEEYLIKKSYDSDVVDGVIDILINQGYLDDKVYANSYVHDKMLLSNYGPNKIRGDLEKLGISSDIIISAILSFDKEMEIERVKKLIDKQIKANHNKGPMVLKKKIQAYLINLGYSIDVINDVLNNSDLKDQSVYEKEYQRAYERLSKKYSGKELEYKLKQKMYQKGFTNYDFE